MPQIGLFDLPAKIDTGAYTSAIHCTYAKVVVEDGKAVLKVKFLDPAHPKYTGEEFMFSEFRKKLIKNSFGQSEERYIISTQINLFGKNYISKFSLSNRSGLKNPILLGRKLLQGNFVVDVALKNESFKNKQIDK